MEELKTQNPAFFHLVIFLVIFGHRAAVGEDDPDMGYHPEERDALYALKHGFNHRRLNKEWNGLQCYMNKPNTWFGISCRDGRVTGITLGGLGLTGQVNVNALVNLTQLTHLSFKNNSIFGHLMDFSANGKLTHLDLSDNMFDGPISPSLVGLDLLESLQLQNNFLAGSIPSFKQLSLREFNVSNNNLSGRIPNTPVLQSFGALSYYNDHGLCGPPRSTACPMDLGANSPEPQQKNKSNGSSLIGVFVVFGAAALVLVAILIFKYYRKTKSNKREEELDYEVEKKGKEEEKEQKEETEEKRALEAREEREDLSFMGEVGGFEISDLLKASADGLGKGNVGSSYKVMLEDRQAVVVKRLKGVKPFTREEFAGQMRVLADLKHPNLLPLVAYYHSKDEKLIISKFVTNGNLFDRLHRGRGKNRNPFNWKSRLSVAKGVARALMYLHLKTKAQNIVPHGNLKSSNVLLDENDEALVSDYGLTSLLSTSVLVQHMVTYKSPEYQQRRKVSRRSDVWSYGLVLLELITGKISICSAPQGVRGVDLCNWAHRAVREEWTAEVFDAEVSATEGALKLLQVALRCCDKSPEKRPEIAEVSRAVEDIKFRNNDDDGSSSFDQSFSISSSSNVSVI